MQITDCCIKIVLALRAFEGIRPQLREALIGAQVSDESLVCVVPAGRPVDTAPILGGISNAALSPDDIYLAVTQLADDVTNPRASPTDAAQCIAGAAPWSAALSSMAAAGAVGGRAAMREALEIGVGRVVAMVVAPERGGRHSMLLTLQVRLSHPQRILECRVFGLL